MERLVEAEDRSPAAVSGQTTPLAACLGPSLAARLSKLRRRLDHMLPIRWRPPGPYRHSAETSVIRYHTGLWAFQKAPTATSTCMISPLMPVGYSTTNAEYLNQKTGYGTAPNRFVK
mmetsp:Transcript_91239/g.254851  ORF Transcript_91239/g.254851 Transcript_91239/m.254851 type:complete len:117 (+) Transcript_91239:85-435(+)